MNINGKSYDSANVHIAMFGSIYYEITKIDYAVKQSTAPHYSLGSNKPTSYSEGIEEYSASMELRLKSIFEIEKAAGGSLLAIKPFDVVVTYVDSNNEIVVDKLKVKFTNQGRSVGSKDEDVVYNFDLMCLGIDFNVTA
ncbi:MAG TPA: hypothetical protein PLN63_05355 [Paludibacteraceae bacterium]|nr:hypothetical protein [Paludibacteraceae bacterium]HOU68028.1 hypothetical protein [Paludibacteraceae bacterium]HPH63027.1 hypothetical protein [Paludibacteraceae bacterium]HQF49953.1 hypothetical protein [Paludibacteraceae bacterium]HQJ89764.1 hypothetical protein [Paludibacteraceae bacterium]